MQESDSSSGEEDSNSYAQHSDMFVLDAETFSEVHVVSAQDYNMLDYDEKVVDGFYDIFGLSTNLNHGKMPYLHDLQTSIEDLGFEVIIINHAVDIALVELEQEAHCIALDVPTTEVMLLVQRISELISQNMGGPVRDANDILAHWIKKSSELRTSLQTSFLPIDFINGGLSRHRALLLKVLADNIGIPCKLVKGSHYTGVDKDAVNIIKEVAFTGNDFTAGVEMPGLNYTEMVDPTQCSEAARCNVADVYGLLGVVILSPHGHFTEANVLGYPNTGGQVVYILDQARVLENKMLLRIKQQGLDITLRILIVTRLLPDAVGTTCE